MNTNGLDVLGRRWALVLSAVVAMGLLGLLFLCDGVISDSLEGIRLGPDVHLELQTLPQYGQFGVTVVSMVIVWLLDPIRRRRLLDWGAAIGVTSLSCFVLKVIAGRPRPKFADPTSFAGFWRAYPFPAREGGMAFRYSWDLTNRHAWDLWSMPSSHTALAAVMSVFLSTLYPRLRPFCVAMLLGVGCCRVLFHEHYPTDVAVGAIMGCVFAHQIIGAQWGLRAMGWIRRKLNKGTAPEVSLAAGVD